MRLSQRFTPIARVGIYVPGGKAAYPSTVLMNAIPARIAGVTEIVMASPSGPEGRLPAEVLVAASESGITEIYRIGGAQAIAALAFGTESIRRVDKITGPGNAYVAAAKRMVFGEVGIDMIAGPTEVVVVADATARAEFVAADLIAQAEHDELASPVCIVGTRAQAEKIASAVDVQLESAPRQGNCTEGIRRTGGHYHFRVEKGDRGHRQHAGPRACGADGEKSPLLAVRIVNAGSIFLGSWSTEALGDYVAGPNHTLPTSGTARFSSPLGVTDFMKFSNVIDITHPALRRLAPHVREARACGRTLRAREIGDDTGGRDNDAPSPSPKSARSPSTGSITTRAGSS